MDAGTVLGRMGDSIGLGCFAWPVLGDEHAFCSEQARKILVADVRGHAALLPLLTDSSAAQFSAALEAGSDFLLNLRLRNARWIELRAILETTGTTPCWLGTIIDTTYRAVEGDTTSGGDSIYRSMADDSPAMIWMGDATGKCIFLNTALRAFWGVNPQDLSTFDWSSTTHPEDRDTLARPFLAAMADQSPFQVEARYRRADGAWRTMRTDARPRFDPQSGTFLGMSGVNTDITDRLEAEQRVAESRRLRDAIMQVSPDAIITMDAEGRFVDVNAGAERVFGFERSEVLGKPVAERIVPPALRQRHHDGMTRYLATGEPQIMNRLVEMSALRADGSTFPIDVAVVRITESDPAVFTAFLRDISDRKAAESHTQMLMGELNHRTKNILTLVQAVARQSARHADPEHFAKDFASRLKGLAASNDLLVKTDWTGVAIHDLIEAHLVHLHDVLGDRLVVGGPALRLAPKAAQTLGMAIHELTTNSVKHGALARARGWVDLTWEVSQVDGASLLSMQWRESGLQGISPPVRKGFGHFVLVDMIAGVMDAEVSVDFLDEGLLWSFRTRSGKALAS